MTIARVQEKLILCLVAVVFLLLTAMQGAPACTDGPFVKTEVIRPTPFQSEFQISSSFAACDTMEAEADEPWTEFKSPFYPGQPFALVYSRPTPEFSAGYQSGNRGRKDKKKINLPLATVLRKGLRQSVATPLLLFRQKPFETPRASAISAGKRPDDPRASPS